MDYCIVIQSVVDEMEKSLDRSVSLNKIIDDSFYSRTHFYRIFNAIVNMNPCEYYRKRKLCEAAKKIILSNNRIIDIAFTYGFESQESFTRAFLKEFSITPGKLRKDNEEIVLFEKANIENLTEELTLKLKNFHTNIVVSGGKQIIGLQATVKPGSKTIRTLWDNFVSRKEEIERTCNSNILGICEYNPTITDDDYFTYIFCSEVKNTSAVPEGMTSRKISAGKYVKVIHNNSIRNLKESYRLFYGTYLPKSNLELEEKDTIEVYHSTDSLIEILIPVK